MTRTFTGRLAIVHTATLIVLGGTGMIGLYLLLPDDTNLTIRLIATCAMYALVFPCARFITSTVARKRKCSNR